MLVLWVIMIAVLVSSSKEKSLGDLENLLYLSDGKESTVEKTQEEMPELINVLDDEEVTSSTDDLKREASELLNMINE